MILIYNVIMYQDGNKVSGSAEKKAEILNGDYFEYKAKNRIRTEFQGAIDRNFIKKDKLSFHWIEHGKIRDSSTFFKVLRFTDSYMHGTFNSTAANSFGISEWVRGMDDLKQISVNPK